MVAIGWSSAPSLVGCIKTSFIGEEADDQLIYLHHIIIDPRKVLKKFSKKRPCALNRPYHRRHCMLYYFLEKYYNRGVMLLYFFPSYYREINEALTDDGVQNENFCP